MKNKTDFLLLFAAGCTVAALIAFSREAKAGAAQGLDLALNTVAPSLLPLLTVFAALENARLCTNLPPAGKAHMGALSPAGMLRRRDFVWTGRRLPDRRRFVPCTL